MLAPLLLAACGGAPEDGNEPKQAPAIVSSNNINLTENTVLNFKLNADQAVTFLLISSYDSQWFELDSETGLLISKNTFDYEAPSDEDRDNSYELSIIATAASGLSTIQNLAVSVNNEVEVGAKVTFPVANSITGSVRNQLKVRGLLELVEGEEVPSDNFHHITVNGVEASLDVNSLKWSAVVPLSEGMNSIDVILMDGNTTKDSQSLIINNSAITLPYSEWKEHNGQFLSLNVGRNSIVQADKDGSVISEIFSLENIIENECLQIEEFWPNPFGREFLMTCQEFSTTWGKIHFMLVDPVSLETSFSHILKNGPDFIFLDERYVVLVKDRVQSAVIGEDTFEADQLTVIDLMTRQEYQISVIYPQGLSDSSFDLREYEETLQFRSGFSIQIGDLLDAITNGVSQIFAAEDFSFFPNDDDFMDNTYPEWTAGGAIKVENASADILVLDQSLLIYEEDSSQLVFRDIHNFSLTSQFDLSSYLLEDFSSWAQVAHSAQRQVMYKASHLHWWENHIWSEDVPFNTTLVTEIDYKSGRESVLLDRLMVADRLGHDPDSHFYITADLVFDEVNQRLLLPVSTLNPSQQSADTGSIVLLSYSLSNNTWNIEFEMPKSDFGGDYFDGSPYITNINENGGFAIVIYRDLESTALHCPTGCLVTPPVVHKLDNYVSYVAFLSNSGNELYYSSSFEAQIPLYELYSHTFNGEQSRLITKWGDDFNFWVEPRGYSQALGLFYGEVDGLLVIMDEESGERVFPVLQ